MCWWVGGGWGGRSIAIESWLVSGCVCVRMGGMGEVGGWFVGSGYWCLADCSEGCLLVYSCPAYCLTIQCAKRSSFF